MNAADAKRMLEAGNRIFTETGDRALRARTARDGQQPYAVVICCSDSRVIPELIFHAGIGELFVIRVAGNVLDRHQLGSVEYAAGHLGCRLVVVLGHTNCGALGAALDGHAQGCVASIVDDIQAAIGDERDPLRACSRNVQHGVRRIRAAFRDAPGLADVQTLGAIYDIESGAVTWLPYL